MEPKLNRDPAAFDRRQTDIDKARSAEVEVVDGGILDEIVRLQGAWDGNRPPFELASFRAV